MIGTFQRISGALAGFLIVTNLGYGSEIVAITRGPLTVTRGDLLRLAVEPSDTKFRVQWWSDGKVVCRKFQCEIDTTKFSPGSYFYDVIVESAAGITTDRISVNASSPPPLYVPKSLSIPLVAPGKTSASARNGQWVVIERTGGIISSISSKSGKTSRIATVAVPIDGATYIVPPGSEAIVRRVGFPEHWLIAQSSSFVVRNGQPELLSGKAIWRKIHTKIAEPTSAKFAGLSLEATDNAWVAVEVLPNGAKGGQIGIHNLESRDLFLMCGPDNRIRLKLGTSRLSIPESSSLCAKKTIKQEVAPDPSKFAMAWSPWWLKDQFPAVADGWRADWSLIDGDLNEDDLLKQAAAAEENGSCADVLDLLGSRQRAFQHSAPFLRTLASCQFKLGLFGGSISTLTDLAPLDEDLSWGYFMRARAYQNMGQQTLALQWFENAKASGYKNIPELSRLAARSAEISGRSRQRLRWLESAWLYENDPTRREKDWKSYESWRAHRPSGGTISVFSYMDNQALPVNSKRSLVMPAESRGSRSLVSRVDLEWWNKRPMSSFTWLKFSGLHNFSSPSDASLGIARRSIHELAVDVISGASASETPGTDGWIMQFGGRLGSGISGNERQRDRLGWKVGASRPTWLGFAGWIESDKYLDPRPGGSDSIDIDLNRYTGPADHSHLDLIFVAELSDMSSSIDWKARFGFGQVDYRTGILDRFDHSLVKSNADIVWSLLPRISWNISPFYIGRTFKLGGGSDQTFGVKSELMIRLAPLWTLTMGGGFENRVDSKDESTSWNNHSYGLGLATQI